MQYDTRHGSPYDRGSADAYYGRSYRPHFMRQGVRVEEQDMSSEELKAYKAGYYEIDEEKSWV